MKPIEVGCLVIVLYSESAKRNEGKVGTVTDRSVEEDGSIVWGVKLSSGTFTHVSGERSLMYFETHKLMRIDGDVEEESQCDEISRVKETENV